MAAAPRPDPWHWPATRHRCQERVSLLRLEGPDTRRVLHGQTSQAIEAAPPGSWLATCCITPTARMRALAEVLVEENGAWLVIRAGDGSAVRTALDRVLFPADRVTLGELQSGLLAVVVEPAGPAAAGAPGTWSPLEGGGGWSLGEHTVVLQEGGNLPAELAALPALDQTGAEQWRLLQGLPAAPGELNEDTNPFELGLADRVSLSKGCYVGQETLAKLASYDGVKQQLRRWLWRAQGASDSVPQELTVGSLLHTASGERAGRLTSALTLPDASSGAGVIGLALVRRGALEQPQLLVGEAGIPIELSVPAAFVPPPTGPGG